MAERPCLACSRTIPPDANTCDCGHVFKESRSPLNGKRYTESRAISLALMKFKDKKITRKRQRKHSPQRAESQDGYYRCQIQNSLKILQKKENKKEHSTTKQSTSGRKVMLAFRNQHHLPFDENNNVSRETMVEALADINRRILSQCQIWHSLPSN